MGWGKNKPKRKGAEQKEENTQIKEEKQNREYTEGKD